MPTRPIEALSTVRNMRKSRSSFSLASLRRSISYQSSTTSNPRGGYRKSRKPSGNSASVEKSKVYQPFVHGKHLPVRLRQSLFAARLRNKFLKHLELCRTQVYSIDFVHINPSP